MRNEFPPNSDRQAEIEKVLSIFASILNGRNAYYISTPMTTGILAVDPWYTVGLGKSELKATHENKGHMVHCNSAHVQAVVHELRRSLASPIIDPTAIADLPGWTQSDYRVLCARIIERYVHTVIFVNGWDSWQYSLGCSYEFLVARQTGARTMNQDLEEISIAGGILLIREAANELQEMSGNTSFHEAVTRELERCA